MALFGCYAEFNAGPGVFGSVSGGEMASGTSSSSTSSTTLAPTSSTTTSLGTSTSDEASTATSEPHVTTGGLLPDFGDVAPVGCQGKLDIIFAISTHHTMEPYQSRLIAAFPEFVKALEEELGGFDLHILVTDSSYTWSMDDCSLCKDPADCDPNGVPELCGAKIDECDYTLGAGETFASELGSSGRRCKLAGGNRYITDEEPDLLAAFDCLGRVGYNSSTPVAFDSILAAVDRPLIETGVELNGPGGCNEGFLRDDALLLLVVIQTMYDQKSAGGPYQWSKAIYEVKGGDRDAVFGLAIITDGDVSPSVCFPGEPAGPSHRIRLFMDDYLEHGRLESICAPSYGPFFKETAAQLAPLCNKFIPR